MWTVSKDEVAELLKLDVRTRLREAKEKESLFERAYQQSFEAFEQTVLQGDEDFEQWDDYYGVSRHFPGRWCDLKIPGHVALSMSEEPLRRIATSFREIFRFAQDDVPIIGF